MDFNVRVLEPKDSQFLLEMVYQGLYVPDGEEPFPREVLLDPDISKYANEWGRHGDIGLVAESAEGQPIGAAWARLFTESHKGFGYVDDNTPELWMCVSDGFRGKGIGTVLMREIEVKAREFGYTQLSLSVDPNNPARKLYERFGYIHVGWCDTSWTMKKSLL